eukprot:754901-Hanusia_phi.AAC.4
MPPCYNSGLSSDAECGAAPGRAAAPPGRSPYAARRVAGRPVPLGPECQPWAVITFKLYYQIMAAGALSVTVHSKFGDTSDRRGRVGSWHPAGGAGSYY